MVVVVVVVGRVVMVRVRVVRVVVEVFPGMDWRISTV